MAKTNLSSDTTAIIKAIENSTKIAQIIAGEVAAELKSHTASDDKRFADLATMVESVAEDVRSLLNSRTFFRGAWWAIVGMSALAGSMMAAIWHYFRG